MQRAHATRAMAVLSALAALAAVAPPAAAQQGPKRATAATRAANDALRQQLPFDDRQAFEDAKRGFLAALPNGGVIANEAGEPVYDLSRYAFIAPDQPAPETVNPSLWRQSQLVTMGGLFQVTPAIYQVRAADLSNITFIEGPEGIVVVDPLISSETARAALDLYYEYRPRKPVVGVIYSHSHVDHYGGVRGVVSQEDVDAGKVRIFAPQGFLEHAVAENVMAGNAMSRRAGYMYGNLLPAGPTGPVGAGLGPTTSAGSIGLIPPTDVVRRNGETAQIGGLRFVFWMAPDSEAAAEMFFFVPEYKAVCTAEAATHTLHDTYSLRGTRIRNPLAWSKYLNQVLYEWGGEAEVLFAPHHWPLHGKARIGEHLKAQRDLYRYLHDQPLRLANHGLTMLEIAEELELPPQLATTWAARGYYGSVSHDAKSTYVKYMGWFDGNPATLHALTPVEAGVRYVEAMGGAKAVLQKARAAYARGEYRWVAQLVNHVVFADPSNQAARDLQADALEQLGYQAESGPWRNFYLSGARELREGVSKGATPDTASPDTIRAMSLELLFDWVAMRVNGPKAAGRSLKLLWDFTDTKERYLVELENGALSHIRRRQARDVDATVTLTRETLDQVLLGGGTLASGIDAGEIQVEGDRARVDELLSLLDRFELWFDIVTP